MFLVKYDSFNGSNMYREMKIYTPRELKIDEIRSDLPKTSAWKGVSLKHLDVL